MGHQCRNNVKDIDWEVQETEHLGHAGTRDANVFGQLGSGADFTCNQEPLPFLGQDRRVTVLPERLRRPTFLGYGGKEDDRLVTLELVGPLGPPPLVRIGEASH